MVLVASKNAAFQKLIFDDVFKCLVDNFKARMME